MDSNVGEKNTRIAKNTIYLYIRMLITMVIGLYMARVVLRVLGASDYGLYNVVGGILSMFTMISASLTIGTQRFLSYAIGEGDDEKLKRTFSIAWGLHVFASLSIIVLAETVGLWFLRTYLNIPDGREIAAFWVYQFTIAGFITTLLQVPFQSCIIAHERMNMYAYMSIYDAIMKLILIILIQYISYDKLILYAALVFITHLSSVIIYNVYCRRHYSECTFKIILDKKLTKEIVAYSGWNLFGGSLSLFTDQGINILLNIFCGTLVNAARGIAMQVNTFVNAFINNFQLAVNPQIIKNFAAKEYESMYRLVTNNGRIAVYLYLLIAIPLIVEIDFVLKLWLGDYPQYTAIFVQIILIQGIETPLNAPVGMCVHASGKMKAPSIAVSLLFLDLPLSYILLKNGFSPIYVFILTAIIYLWRNGCNIYFANKYTGIPIKLIVKSVYLNTLLGGIMMYIIPLFVSYTMEQGWYRFLVVSSISIIWSLIIIYELGLTPGMKALIINKISNHKLFLKNENRSITHGSREQHPEG